MRFAYQYSVGVSWITFREATFYTLHNFCDGRGRSVGCAWWVLQLRVDAECADLVPSLRMTLPTEKQMGRLTQAAHKSVRTGEQTS